MAYATFASSEEATTISDRVLCLSFGPIWCCYASPASPAVSAAPDYEAISLWPEVISPEAAVASARVVWVPVSVHPAAPVVRVFRSLSIH
jgi:hypothetical protein